MKATYATPILEARGDVRRKTMASAASSSADSGGNKAHVETDNGDSNVETTL